MTEEERAAAEAEAKTNTSPDAGNDDATSVTPVSPTPEEVEALKAELAASNKRADQAEMERNLRRKEAEEAKVKALEETERYKEANEELKKQAEEREAEESAAREQKQVDELRGKIISEFPTEVQEIAKDLNLYWDSSATNTAEAETQLREKLGKIQARIGQVDDEGTFTPRINANNPDPNEGTGGKKFEDMTSEEMRAILPKAPAR